MSSCARFCHCDEALGITYQFNRFGPLRTAVNRRVEDVVADVGALVGTNLSLLDATGVLDLSHNWFKAGVPPVSGTDG